MTDPSRTARRRRKAEIAMRELAAKGNPKAAAAALGIAERTMRRRITDYCEAHGYETPLQAAYWLDRP